MSEGYRPEQIAEIQKERMLEQAEAIKEGAEVTPQGEVLYPSGRIEKAREEMASKEKNIDIAWKELLLKAGADLKDRWREVLAGRQEYDYSSAIDKLIVDEATKKALLEKAYATDELDKGSTYGQKFAEEAVRFSRAEMIAKEGPEEKKNRLIQEAGGIDELKKAIQEIGYISGTKSEYSPDEIVGLIIKVIIGELPDDAITKSYGLRDKTVELRDKHFGKEVNSAKNFGELRKILEKMYKLKMIENDPDKLYENLLRLRKDIVDKGGSIEDWDSVKWYRYLGEPLPPLDILYKIKDLFSALSKKKGGKSEPPPYLYETPKGTVAGRMVGGKPGGPYIIETPQGKLKVEKILHIKKNE